MGGAAQGDGWSSARGWVERRERIGVVARGNGWSGAGDGRSGAGVWAEQRGGMGGVAQWDGSSGARAWEERRRGVGGVARRDRCGGAGDGRNGAGEWVEQRGGMGGAARGDGGVARGDGGVARGDGWYGAEDTSELRGNGGGSNKKDAVLKGRTRRLQTLNSVWKGNYCSGIGDGGAIKSTKQREASAVPYRFVMVIPSVMKLSSPK